MISILLTTALPLIAEGADPARPRDRATAEDRQTHFSRYTFGNFAGETLWALGAKVNYTGNGATVTEVLHGTAAETAGLKKGDIILEVNGVPVGWIRDRLYAMWKEYRRTDKGDHNSAEFTIAFKPDQWSDYKYYFPVIDLDRVAAGAPDVE